MRLATQKILLACALIGAIGIILATHLFAQTDIFQAVRSGNAKTVEKLLKADRTLANARQKDKKTPLMIAAKKGLVVIAKLLINAGAEIDATLYFPDMYHQSVPVIAFAIDSKSLEMVKLLLDAAAQQWPETHGNLTNSFIEYDFEGDRNRRVLHHAILIHAPIEIIKLLIEKGAQVNGTDWTNWHYPDTTPLMAAAKTGYTEAAKVLLEAGADPTLARKDGKTALDYAKEAGRTDIITLLQAALQKK